jgi:ABC-type sugar transport system ATPase subunit
MTGIRKRFPGVRALDDVDFELMAGEIHALLGENTAGKSTLLKILSGAQQPDQGTLTFAGKAVTLNTPYDAQQLGIVTI